LLQPGGMMVKRGMPRWRQALLEHDLTVSGGRARRSPSPAGERGGSCQFSEP
jgi:hypothetical protein